MTRTWWLACLFVLAIAAAAGAANIGATDYLTLPFATKAALQTLPTGTYVVVDAPGAPRHEANATIYDAVTGLPIAQRTCVLIARVLAVGNATVYANPVDWWTRKDKRRVVITWELE